MSFHELVPEQALWVVNEIARLTPRDYQAVGRDWQGYVNGVWCRGYLSPDGKVLRFTYGEDEVFQSLSEAAAFGFSVGDAVPNWAKLGD